ncbi:hypothetical protein EDB86DRAFT_534331 [Lactarius hatsudake]|nr:hypothetical protein EDB86DRAFT_534331 [Lactarius hatsudake]
MNGLTTSNQTNLAIKGIIAIRAMSMMSSVVKQRTDYVKYYNTAAVLYSQWKGLALARDQHLLAAYGLADSWTLGYNLFADAWLGTALVESSVYDSQSSFIYNFTATLVPPLSAFGMPVDSYSADMKIIASSWTLFVAAMTSDEDLSTNLISRVHSRASLNTSPRAGCNVCTISSRGSCPPDNGQSRDDWDFIATAIAIALEIEVAHRCDCRGRHRRRYGFTRNWGYHLGRAKTASQT